MTFNRRYSATYRERQKCGAAPSDETSVPVYIHRIQAERDTLPIVSDHRPLDMPPRTEISVTEAALIPRMLLGIVGSDTNGLLLRGMVRLSARSNREYDEAREILIPWHQGDQTVGQFAPVFLAADRMEASVEALHRGYLYEAALGDSNSPSYPRPKVEIERLRLLRNRIQHYDQDILNGETIEDLPVVLDPRGDGVTLGAAHLEYVTFVKLLDWLTRRTTQILSSLT